MKKKIFLPLLCLGILVSSLVGALPQAQEDKRVQKIYEHFEHKSLWIDGKKWTPCAEKLLSILSHAEEEGLWKETYEPFLSYLETASLEESELRKEADALLTLAALTYISDMRGKRIDPHAVDKTIHAKPPPVDEAALLIKYLSTPEKCGWIEEFSPKCSDYQRLKKLLARYRDKQKAGGWPQLPEGTKLERGDKGPLIKLLREQLIAQDVLDSTDKGDVFETSVEKAIKHFQSLHGLETDGKVGPATLKALNTSVEERIHSIIVTLERHRWLPCPVPPRYIQVNIPGFYLKAVEGEDILFMRIITGKEYRKTPVFDAPMTSIVFNPAWHVPPGMAARDKLPKLKRNPHALSGKGYRFFDSSGREVNPGSVNWGAYSSGHLPIRIVQSPGASNALGKIRFTIDNPFSIYLHGTSQQELFKKAKRSLSSGCIRVEYPVKLAEFVLNDAEKWGEKKIEKASSGTATRRVKLEKNLPVFVAYLTVFQDKNNEWNFADDEYHQDSKIWKALEKTRPQKDK